MRFATLRDDTLDGRPVLVSHDLTRCVDARPLVAHLHDALRRWAEVAPALQALQQQLDQGQAPASQAFDPAACAAPLPRSPQWCDGSAFLHHGRLMDQAFGTPPIPDLETLPLMYQGASDDFLGPHADVPLPREQDGIDFEGEFGVVVDEVPLGVSAEAALGHVRLIVQLNDWSLRGFGPREMRTGFGFLQAKPSTAFAPVAVTPDELGAAWEGGRVQMRLLVQRNDQAFGQADGGEMHFHFGQLIAHAAHTRRLSAGTIIGSGTVSNRDRGAGSSCIAERRVIEMIDRGRAETAYLHFGERVRMQAVHRDGRPGPFGQIAQRVVAAYPTTA